MSHIDRFTREHKGVTINVTWERDDDVGPPWKEHDGHGPVSEWRSGREKKAGERVLSSDNGSYRFYDFAEAMRIAKRDQWGDPAAYEKEKGHKPTPGQLAAWAVEADFEFLKRWCEDDWFWCGRIVTIEGYSYRQKYFTGTPENWHEVWSEGEALWGIDSDSIEQFTEEAFKDAIQWLDRELANSEDAACRDILTV